MIIGITGSFGSGKTTVANIFGKYGFRVINVDKLYHGIYSKNKILKSRIKKEFETLNRNKIKKIVFNDSKKLKRLNELTHPIIIKEIKRIIKSNNTKIIIDAPLLIEANAQKLVDKIILVKCNKKEQIRRILKKKKHSRKEIDQIIKSQIPLNEKIKHADFVVDNNKAIKQTENQIKNMIDAISSP